MQTSHSGTIRGLSIATIILTILTILGLLLCLALLGVGGVAMNDPTVQNAASIELSGDADAMAAMAEMGLTEDDAFGMLAFVFGLGAAFIVWAIICCIIALIAGIKGLKAAKNSEKLGGAFGWAVAGAIASFLGGSIIVMILLIISAVCISKDRKAATTIPYGQPAAYYGAPQQPQQMYGAPQQPYGAPQQPYSAPQQPADPAGQLPDQNNQRQ